MLSDNPYVSYAATAHSRLTSCNSLVHACVYVCAIAMTLSEQFCKIMTVHCYAQQSYTVIKYARR